jgi:hypothetical protein
MRTLGSIIVVPHWNISGNNKSTSTDHYRRQARARLGSLITPGRAANRAGKKKCETGRPAKGRPVERAGPGPGAPHIEPVERAGPGGDKH